MYSPTLIMNLSLAQGKSMLPLVALYLVACIIVSLYGRNSRLGLYGVFCASVFLTPITVAVGLLLFGNESNGQVLKNKNRPLL